MADCRIGKWSNRRILFLAAVLLLLLPLPAFAKPRILLLHSYHPGYEWTDRVQEGMEVVLTKEAPEAELCVEYMDTKRHASEALFPELRRFYASKFAGQGFDVILCSDDNALDFLLTFREQLFPGVPVVFCGINSYKKERLAGHRGFTGVAEEFDLRGTLELALRLHPQTRQVAVVSDVTTSSQANLERLRKMVPFFSERVDFIELAALTAADLQKALAALPPHTIVLHLDYLRGPAGQNYTLKEGLALVTESSEYPVYAPWDMKIQAGVVGGKVVSGRLQGETAARLALRVLRGEAVESIPVMEESPNVNLFDYPALKRFGIDPASLPQDSVVLNDPNVALRKHYHELCWAIGLAAILGLLATGLTIALFDRQKAIKALNENRELFRTVADFTYDWELWLGPDGHVIYVSPSCERITGYGPQLLERIVHPADLEAYRRHDVSSEVTSLEFRIVSRDGRVRWIEHICRAIYDARGKNLGRRASNRDVTDRKFAEEKRRESEGMFNAMLQSIPDHVSVLDSNLQIVWANDTAKEVFGEHIVGSKCHQVYYRKDAPCESCRCPVGEMFLGGPHQYVDEMEMTVENGEKRYFHRTASVALRNQAGIPTGVLLVARDITDHKQAEMALRDSEELHRVILTNISDAVFITDDAGALTFVCPSASDIFDLSVDDIWQKGNISELLGENLFSREKLMQQGGELHNIERDICDAQGKTRSLLINEKRVSIQGGTILYACRDVTEMKKAQQNLELMSFYDTLTGLPNRVLLDDHLALALEQAKRAQKMVAVLLLDLDHFKHVNDSLGHAKGDLLLQGVARRLAAVTRKCDTLARWGGDEFVMLLTGLDNEIPIIEIASRILEELNDQPFDLEGNEIFISASIGIALFPQDSATPDALLKHADAAMYEAKKTGRNAFHFFSQSLYYQAVERHQMESRLRRALRCREFFLVYQPQFDLSTGRTVGVEALVRWQDPESGLVSPAEFIPLAEETGLIRPLGEWILHTACAQAAAWQGKGHGPLRLGVNLSAQQFRQPDLIQLIEGTLQKTGLDPQLLELELTESAFMENTTGAIETLTALKAQGIRFAIDDFGTGYSSLSYLKHLPIDRIKIAQEFVRDVLADTSDSAIVEATIAMASSLGLQVIAEGVENREQVDFLLRLGCSEMQGYYFAKPMAADLVGSLLTREAVITGQEDRPVSQGAYI